MPRRRREQTPAELLADAASEALELAEELLGAFEVAEPPRRARRARKATKKAPAPTPKRRDWNSLSEAQKKRYLSAGKTGKLSGTPGLTSRQVRAYYERGGNLTAARGHARPKGGAPRKAALRAAQGKATDTDLKALAKWRRSQAPEWLPRNREVMSDDTAALLSQIPSHPRNWKSIEVRMTPDREAFVVIVKTKRGATYTTILPDRASVGELASLLRNRELEGRSAAEKRRLKKQWTRSNGEAWSIDVRIYDTDAVLVAPAKNEPPTFNVGQALPRKR